MSTVFRESHKNNREKSESNEYIRPFRRTDFGSPSAIPTLPSAPRLSRLLLGYPDSPVCSPKRCNSAIIAYAGKNAAIRALTFFSERVIMREIVEFVMRKE